MGGNKSDRRPSFVGGKSIFKERFTFIIYAAQMGPFGILTTPFSSPNEPSTTVTPSLLAA